MDIWETLYEKARGEYHPEDVTPFIHAHHVVCALESVDGRIYTGFCIESCCGVMDLCAERTAALNMGLPGIPDAAGPPEPGSGDPGGL